MNEFLSRLLLYLENVGADMVILGKTGVVEFTIECRSDVIVIDNLDVNDRLRRQRSSAKVRADDDQLIVVT